MKSFHHINAKTVDEAVNLLERYGGRAKLIAGGTDLLGFLKHRILQDYPEVIINVKTISEAGDIKEDSEGLKIGALTKLADIAGSGVVREKYRLLAEAAESVATPQIRNMATVGGNLCQGVRCWYYRYPHEVGERFLCRLKGGKDCYALTGENQYHSIFGALKGCVAVNPSDIGVALLALDARITITGPGGTSLASVIPIKNGVCEDARIALGAVAPKPFRAVDAEQRIKGRVVNEAAAEAAAEASVKQALPLSKNSYKIKIVKALVKRAILSSVK
jgi:xanthine dehydrogenase YagS FAD-binding subunit